MGDPIFDRHGRTVGWIEDDVIYDRTPQCRAFVEDGAVFTFGGAYLGVFDHGFFRDPDGHAVAFLEGAEEGPPTPLTELAPLCPLLPLAPLQPLTSAPLAPLSSLGWSPLDWDEFLTS